MADLLWVAAGDTAPTSVPGLALLGHNLRPATPDPDALAAASEVDAVVVDGRTDLVGAHAFCRLLVAAGNATPVLLVLGEGGFAVVRPDWGVSDIVGEAAGPAEWEARLRLRVTDAAESGEIVAGPVTIDADGYRATLAGRTLDLTYTEFELLRYLASRPGRAFSREQLLTDVWGYDYYGGARTVDVHVRRLRAKLGIEYEGLIQTVRNVGYRFSPRHELGV